MLLAHVGMRASAQTHTGENDTGLMEAALAVLAILSVSILALKEAIK